MNASFVYCTTTRIIARPNIQPSHHHQRNTICTRRQHRRPNWIVSSAAQPFDLSAQLDSDDQRTVLPLLATLQSHTPATAETLRASKAIRSPNRAIRAAAHAALGRVGNKDQDEKFLGKALDSLDDSSVRAAAGCALGELGAHNMLSLIARIAKDLTQPYIVRYSCVVALGSLGGDNAVNVLISINATPLEITGAVSALTEINKSFVVHGVKEYVAMQAMHEDDLVRGAVARAYGVWSRIEGDERDYFRIQLDNMLRSEEINHNSPHVRNMLAQAVLPGNSFP